MNPRAGHASHRDLSDYLMLPGKWVHQAACARHARPDLWHPPVSEGRMLTVYRPRNEQETAAIAICRKKCPVRNECLKFALSMPPADASGVWGATTDSERMKLRGLAA